MSGIEEKITKYQKMIRKAREEIEAGGDPDRESYEMVETGQLDPTYIPPDSPEWNKIKERRDRYIERANSENLTEVPCEVRIQKILKKIEEIKSGIQNPTY